LYGYLLQYPVNFIDPFGQWTLQIGLGLNTGAGVGTTKSIGLAMSYSKNEGLQVGGYATAGIGAHASVTGDLVMDITASTNDSISDLSGTAVIVGGGVATPTLGTHVGLGAEVSLPTAVEGNATPSFTVSPGIGIGMPTEVHDYWAYTEIFPLFNSGGKESNCP
jgi:hypothetical protein